MIFGSTFILFFFSDVLLGDQGIAERCGGQGVSATGSFIANQGHLIQFPTIG